MVKSPRTLLRGNALLCLFSAVMLPSAQAQNSAATAAQARGTQPGGYYAQQPAAEPLDLQMYGRIRAEGMTHGRAMDFASALSDGIGPRLTGSPNMQRANDWTRDTLTKMGLKNAHLEDWGEFGMGWSQVNAWARMITPDTEPIWLQAAVWSIATPGPVTGQVVYIPLTDVSQLSAFQGKLKGKIVLLGPARTVADLNQPLSYRYTDEDLQDIEGAGTPKRMTGPLPDTPQINAERKRLAAMREAAVKMMQQEGVAAILLPARDNGRGGGTGIVFNDNTINLLRPGQLPQNRVPVPYATVMIEHYNRLARLAQAGVPVTVQVNLQTTFTGDHQHGFNTLAEIPGTDPALKDQVVMVGGHLDSWVAGTGATDNGAGAVIAMEAMRILAALDAKPRRTIRIGLWGGEEQGELGSRGYVHQHLDPSFALANPANPSAPAAPTALAPTKDWQLLDAYYNIDEGGGRVRGIYTQGNYAVAPIFTQWIAPLKDLGVTAVTTRSDIGSDHESFDSDGLPGFEFLQDELDYETRTHHSNMDTVDHLHAEDMEQAAIVEAIFLWNTSQRDAMMPRKPFPHPEDETPKAAPLVGLFPKP